VNSLKVLSALLCYPDQELLQYQDDMKAVLNHEAVLEASVQASLISFIDNLCTRDLMDSQAEYVETFDRGRSLSLLLFEHVHGESRDRGQAMVNLLDIYKENGFDITANELPDYIPLYLEYLSQRLDAEILDWLSEIEHILALLATRLQEREHPYQIIFQSLLSLLDGNVDMQQLRRSVAKEERDDTPEALDKVWEEAAVKFGGDDPAAGGCGSNAQQGQTQTVSVDSIRRRSEVQ
jgi:nitrate reductase delta subunit